MSAPLLQLNGVSAGYGGRPAVADITLEVGPGEMVGLFGPNGAGKTTTLLAVSGLIDVLAGDIRIGGETATGRPHDRARDGVAHVLEERGLFPSLTVAEHLRLVRGSNQNDNDRVVGWLPALERLMDRRVGLLSGGEQQMVALARALKSAPRLLMVDEMSLGLAPLVARSLLETISGVASDSGCGVLLVEQHVSMALTSVDRAYIMNRGSIVDADDAEAFRSDPDRLEVNYLG